jgi:hypothetical protein
VSVSPQNREYRRVNHVLDEDENRRAIGVHDHPVHAVRAEQQPYRQHDTEQNGNVERHGVEHHDKERRNEKFDHDATAAIL